MKHTFDITRKYSFDVAVVGGGTAGVFAAISAARSGVRTVLIEKTSRLGGTVTTANVNFPGLFYAWGKKIIDGPCWEAVERCVSLGGAVIPEISYKPERHWHEQILLNRFTYTYVLNEMVKEAGITVLTNAMISHAAENENAVMLFVTDKSGLMEIDSKIAIDATGDANLAGILKYPLNKSQTQQPATLQNHLSGYNIDEITLEEIEKRLEDSDLSAKYSARQLRHFLVKGKIDNHTLCKDADTSEGKTALEFAAIESLMEVFKFYKTFIYGITVDFIAEETGVRETNKIAGEKEITAKEYLSGTFYPDSVCYAFYPIDLHIPDGIDQSHLKDGVVPKIPYSALIPKGAKRLICPGRHLSSDTYANSALRVQAPCMAMGQVSGCAAAIAAKHNINILNVDYKELCKALTDLGAIVPVNK